MKKITVIGAGKIGSTIANMLAGNIFPDARHNSYEITVADEYGPPLGQKSLQFLDSKHLRHVVTSNHKELKELLDGQDYVINAGPYFINTDLATVASKTGTNYFDLTEDVQQTANIMAIANKCKNEQVFVPQCGLAPGFISIVANHLANQFDEVHDIKMRVGALPKYPNNRLKYNMTWSTDGLVNEYLHPCDAIRDGEIVKIDPLEGYEIFSFDGNEYEAFNTSGGLGSMCETWVGKVHNMDYKTARYVGHLELMKFLIEDLELGEENGRQLKEILNKSIPATSQDVVLIFVAVSGYKNGRLVQDIWTKKIYGQNGWSAIQLTTAAGICGMVHLHRIGELPTKGFIKQEQADFLNFINAPNVRLIY